MKKLALSFCGAFFLAGCMGYHVGPIKPAYLKDIHSIAVPTFRNSTLLPRIEVLVTGTVIKQFQQDGTFEIASDQKADAVLKGDIIRVSRAPARSVTGDVLATAEFAFSIVVRYTLVNRSGQVIVSNSASGSTTYFVGSDVTTDERQAFPLATEQLATHLVSQLSEGW